MAATSLGEFRREAGIVEAAQIGMITGAVGGAQQGLLLQGNVGQQRRIGCIRDGLRGHRENLPS
jgi:hypothetical protein